MGKIFWSLALPCAACRLAPAEFVRALILLGTAGLFSAWLARSSRPGRDARALFILGLWVAVTWLLRDRLHLLGDGQLWLHSADSLGLRTPGYREPLAVLIQMSVAWLTAGWCSPARAMEFLSCLCGMLTGVGLSGYARFAEAGLETTVRRVPSALLLFGAPLSLVFYGHIETYPLFVTGLAFALPVLRADLRRGRPRGRTLAVLAVLVGLHLTALLLVPPLLLVYFRGRKWRQRRLTAVSVGLLFLGGIAAGILPGWRGESTLGQHWTRATFLDYAAEVANGWTLLLLPPCALLWSSRRHFGRTPMTLFLSLAALNFTLLPLIGLFKLGLYRDLDLLAPAFLLLVFLLLECEIEGGTQKSRDLFLHALVGLPLLAALLALNQSPAGFGYFERRLATSRAAPEHRVYGYETLARALRERQDLAGAGRAVDEAIALVPTNTRLHGLRGEILAAAGDTAGALQEMARALHSNRGPEVRALMAGLELRRGHPRVAVALLTADDFDAAASASASATLATAYFRLGQPDSSLLTSDLRLARSPADARAHANRAAALIALRRSLEAFEELEAAVRLDPGVPEYRRQRDTLGALLRESSGR